LTQAPDRAMLSTLLSVSALLLSFAILCLGHGLNNTLLGVRATLEDYPEWVTGLMMSAYFVGFIFGTFFCARLIPAIGQIRTFAALASIASAISLLHVLFVNEITWILLRLVYGSCISGLYMVIESWLNVLSNRKNRGRILSVYMTISFLALALGQGLIYFARPETYQLFAIVSVLISFSLVPLTISKSKQPDNILAEAFSFHRLYTISPLATIGSFASGIATGAFWGLGAVYFTQLGFSSEQVATLIGLTFFGGLLFQTPIGYLSDIFDRRVTIVAVLFISVVTCLQIIMATLQGPSEISGWLITLILVFGGTNYTLYSLFIALANDFLEPRHAVKASGGLLTFHGIGAIFGPVLASLAMLLFGNNGLFMVIALVNGVLFLLAGYRMRFGREIPEATSEGFVPMPKTGAALFEMDPRQDEQA
jgi:MFS family permease